MGIEVVVRPVVFPNIRPAPARSLPPVDDPDKGFAEIKGNGATQVTVSNSWSGSSSTSKQKEIKRRVDEARVYQQEDNGTVNKDNFVDIEVPNKLWMKGPAEKSPGFNGDDVSTSPLPGQGFNGDDIVPKSKSGNADEVTIQYYKPVKAANNIEIKKKNKIISEKYDITK